MCKFYVGDKVIIKNANDWDYVKISSTVGYVKQLQEYIGKHAVIESVMATLNGNVCYVLDVDKGTWCWDSSQLELLEGEEKDMTQEQLYFAKVRPNAIIPSKRQEDAGYDIYADFEERFMVIKPNETKLIPTGICSAFSHKYVAILKERGSTGTKGMAQRCGVIDSGFRGEWFVPITNVNNVPIVIAKSDVSEDEINMYLIGDIPVMSNFIVYPYTKAICQAIMVEVPKLQVKQVSLETIKSFASERQDGALGSSQK